MKNIDDASLAVLADVRQYGIDDWTPGVGARLLDSLGTPVSNPVIEGLLTAEYLQSDADSALTTTSAGERELSLRAAPAAQMTTFRVGALWFQIGMQDPEAPACAARVRWAAIVRLAELAASEPATLERLHAELRSGQDSQLARSLLDGATNVAAADYGEDHMRRLTRVWLKACSAKR